MFFYQFKAMETSRSVRDKLKNLFSLHRKENSLNGIQESLVSIEQVINASTIVVVDSYLSLHYLFYFITFYIAHSRSPFLLRSDVYILRWRL